MNEFFTWGTLATLAGATLAVGLITQFIKDVPSLKKVPTQLVSYILSVIILIAANLFIGVRDASLLAIIPINAVIVSTAANGAYAAVQRATQGKDNTKSE